MLICEYANVLNTCCLCD